MTPAQIISNHKNQLISDLKAEQIDLTRSQVQLFKTKHKLAVIEDEYD